MKRLRIIIIALSLVFQLAAQGVDTAFIRQITQHREEYKTHFLTDPRSPLRAKDTAYLDFYAPDPAWRIPARLTLTPEAAPFDMLTYSGVTRLYQQYGILDFEADGKAQQMRIYQNLTLIAKDSSFRDYLFLPFKDLTNAQTTYGGGRYMDFKTGDINDNILILDFNKCYNPWCAYSDGFNCPVPPRENHLKMEVTAGEKGYLKKVKRE
jgi:uncharacterized protein (DUF1684 family)